MSCILSSYGSNVWVELLVRSWNTVLVSSSSQIIAQNVTWFEAWNPSQDSLSMIIRQESVQAQYSVIQCIQRWMQGNEILNLNWPERNINYDVVVSSASLVKQYNSQMKDLEVSFLLLTNSFQTTRTSFSYSETALDMFTKDLIDLTIDSAKDYISEQQKKEQVDKAIKNMQQFDGCSVIYNADGTINVTIKRVQNLQEIVQNGNLGGPLPLYSYTYNTKLTYDLLKKLENGGDLQTYMNKLVSSGKAELISKREAEKNEIDKNKVPTPAVK